ncbi:MAG: chromate efflux transporter [SAR202 cluster bacterium]|nr:chromate efflux transporter [SAR202 cluster bacterium]
MKLTASKGRLKEAAVLFARLGLVSFGGPAAHIALMRDEVVRRRNWMGDQDFLDMVGATNLIPGPNSTEMAIHLGKRRAGWWGYLAGGVLFILPATLIVLALAVVYVRYGSIPQVEWLLYGIKPIMVAIVLFAVWGLARGTSKTLMPILAAITVAFLYVFGVNELLLLAAGGLVFVAIKAGWRNMGHALLLLPLAGGMPVLAAQTAGGYSLLTLTLNFLKIGAVLYGSGYVLLAYLRSDFVERLGWLTDQQLIDAIAVGQVTPGPVSTAATFIGYLTGSYPGAVLATVAIFLPAFVFVALLSHILPLVRRHEVASAALDGVNAASLGLMAGVAWQLGRAAVTDWFTVAALLAAVAVAWLTKLNTLWLILAGGVAGILFRVVSA